jgi:hypothetical protein
MLAHLTFRGGKYKAVVKYQIFDMIAHVLAHGRKRAENMTKEDRDIALKRMLVYVSWFKQEIFQADGTGKSKTIIIVPHGRAEPLYRDLSEHDGQCVLQPPLHI